MRVKDEEQIASRRALIMRAAREIMETQGMEALSIRKIAAMIQQTPGIIYHYFSGKEELMLAVVQEGYQHILCIIQQTMASEKSPAAQLRATLFGYVRGRHAEQASFRTKADCNFAGKSAPASKKYCYAVHLSGGRHSMRRVQCGAGRASRTRHLVLCIRSFGAYPHRTAGACIPG